MRWLLVLWTIAAGISNPIQSGSNAMLQKTMQAPVAAALVVYAIGTLCLLAASVFLGLLPRTALARLAAVPWWALTGGVCNALFLMTTLLVTRKLGSASFTTIIVIAAIVTSVVLDNFGLLGFHVRPATPLRLLGAGLALTGVVLVSVY